MRYLGHGLEVVRDGSIHDGQTVEEIEAIDPSIRSLLLRAEARHAELVRSLLQPMIQAASEHFREIDVSGGRAPILENALATQYAETVRALALRPAANADIVLLSSDGSLWRCDVSYSDWPLAEQEPGRKARIDYSHPRPDWLHRRAASDNDWILYAQQIVEAVGRLAPAPETDTAQPQPLPPTAD